MLIVPVVSGEDEDGRATVVANPFLDAEAVGEIEVALEALGAKGGAEQVTRVVAPSLPVASVVAVGLGKDRDEWPADTIRRAAGVAARSLNGTEAVITTLSDIDLSAAVEGLILGAYRFTEFRSEKTAPKDSGPARDHRADRRHQGQDQGRGRQRAADIATAVATARDLVNTPPSHLYPAEFAKRAKALGESTGLEVEVLDEKDTGQGRLWRRDRRRQGLVTPATAGPAGSPGSEEQEGQEGRAGRQGHHIRHRRHLHQAVRQHAPHDLRHGRSRRSHRHCGAGRQAAVADRRRSPPCRWPRTCPRRPRSGPAMC